MTFEEAAEIRPRTRAAIVIGDSHYGAIASYVEQAIPHGSGEGAELIFFNAWKYSLAYEYSTPNGEAWVLNPELAAQIKGLLDRFDECQIYLLFGGGHHSALTLLRHPRPFDFVLPENPKLPREAGVELLPSAYVEDMLLTHLPASFKNIKSIVDEYPNIRCFQFESPPANGDDKFVLDNLGQWFQNNFSEKQRRNVSPRWVRYKMWRLHSDLYRRECSKLGVSFVPAPAESTDDEGFLLPSCYGHDSTHGSPAYGKLLVSQIEERLGARIGRWSTFG